MPGDLAWPEYYVEHQRVDFTEPIIDIIVSKDMIGGPPKKQRLVLFDGEMRSDLIVTLNGDVIQNMSYLLT